MSSYDRLESRRPRRWPLAVLTIVAVWAAVNLPRDILPSQASAVARPPSAASAARIPARAKKLTPPPRKSAAATNSKPEVAPAPGQYTIAHSAASFVGVSPQSPNITDDPDVQLVPLDSETGAAPPDPRIATDSDENTIAQSAASFVGASPESLNGTEKPAVAPVSPPTDTEPPSPDPGLTAVGDVLVKYQRAYTRLDPSAAAAISPGVDAQALTRDFAQLARQNLSFDECSIVLAEISATAHCIGLLEYVRVGNNRLRTERRGWTIELRREGQDWHIVNVATQ